MEACGPLQVYSLVLGRRKSWIVPIQAMSGIALLLSANWADARLQVQTVKKADHADSIVTSPADALLLLNAPALCFIILCFILCPELLILMM